MVGNDEKAVGDKITVTANTTVKAIWKDIPVVTYTVSFDANGGTGTMADATGISGEYTLPANGFTAPTGQQFKAWMVGNDEKAAGDKITVTANTTVTAVWENIPVATYTVSFDANGGTGTMADVTGVSGEYTLPANGFTAPDGKQFKAWMVGNDEKAAGDKITVTANTTVTAIWEVIPVVTYTVSFDANGGTGTMADVTGISGEYTLPANGFTAPSGQQFKAWNVGGSEYAAGAAINVAADTTVKAVWKTVYTGGGYGVSASYGVTVLDCVGADVKVSDKYAYAGEKITITIVPEQGKRVDTVAVADKNGKAVEVSCTADGTYTFKMPKSKVTVQVQTVDIIRIEMVIDNPCILFNGEPFVNDVPPVLIHDRTMVPVSVITAMLGGTSEWDGTTRQVTLHLDGQTFVMTIDQVIAGFDVAPIILDSRTYVPVGYIMGVLGADVQWIGDTREVIIQK